MNQNDSSDLSEVLQHIDIKFEIENSADFEQWLLRYSDRLKEESGELSDRVTRHNSQV